MDNPATSYIAATFHPTIVQRAHQSLSSVATPKLGMIPPGIRVKAGLHIAMGHNQSNQHSWVYQAFHERPSQHSLKTNHCIPQHTNPFTSLWRREGQPGIIPSQRWAQLKSTRQHGVVLGPIVAKTTQQQYPIQGISATQLPNQNGGNNPQPIVDKKQNSQHNHGNSSTEAAINNHPQRGEDNSPRTEEVNTHAQSEMERGRTLNSTKE